MNNAARMLLVLALATPVLSAAGQPADTAAAKLAERLRPIDFMAAEFTQTVTGARQQVLQQAAGRLYVARPLRFRWELDAPYEQLVVTGEDRLYVYDPDLAQVNVEPLAEALEGTPALILAGDLGHIEAAFDVTMTADDGVEHFELTPRTPASMYTRLTLRFEDGRLDRLDIVDGLDQRTRVQLTGVIVNEPLAADLFSFEVPPDTDVIGDVRSAAD